MKLDKDMVSEGRHVVKIYRLTDEQFKAALKEGRITNAVEIGPDEQHASPEDSGSRADEQFTDKQELELKRGCDDRSGDGANGVSVTDPHKQSLTERETVIQKLATFLKRFVFLQRPSQYTLLAAWIVGTYLYKEFEFIGYVFAHSPEPQSGKTTLLHLTYAQVLR